MLKNKANWGKSLLAGCLTLLASAGISQTVTFNYTGAVQSWTVPAGVTSINIDARGAQGGGSFGGAGGLGARMVGDFAVTPGENLSIVVGQMGQLQVGGNAQNSSGGGGGSFVFTTSGPNLLVAAGGGGGKCNWTSSSALHSDAAGQVTTTGGASSDGNPGGTGGNGGPAGLWSSVPCAGGGTGWLSAGGGPYGGLGYNTWTGGPGYCGGGGGGCGGVGGFGGGGGGGNHYGGGGGGGGYSGGGGGTDPTHGGGGGSYSIGTGQNNTAGFQIGDGIVIISYTPSTICDTLTAVTVSPSLFCAGSPADFSATTTGAGIAWYDAMTGGNLLGTSTSGAPFTITPSATTTLYAEVIPQPAAPQTSTFNYTGTVQTWTVPAGVTSITVDARGAQGGGSFGGAGGLGARMVGDFGVTPGENLTIIVGEQGLLQVGGNAQNSSGGGGGSFVFTTSGPNLLVAAGGGGGKCNWTSSVPLHADAAGQVTTSGGASSDGNPGGTGGNGGNAGLWSSVPCAGGGTGWLSAGGGPYGGLGYNTWTGGPGYCGGGGGGCGGVGGFGGGGGGGNHYGGGGGGGGYSGGGGGTDPTHGGGGGSYSIGTNQNNTAGFQTGNGQVIITYNGASCTPPARQAVTVYADTVVPAAVCQNFQVSLDSTGSASISAIDVNGGSTDNCGISGISISDSAFNCNDVGQNTVILTVVDANGNADTCSAIVMVIPLPLTANFSFSVFGAGLQYDFTNLSIGGLTWSWDFGDGNTSTLENPSHTYAVDGSYMVCLTASDSCFTSTSCQTLTVVSISRPFGKGEVQLWPNPAQGQFNVLVEGLESDHLSLELYNLAGQQVMKRDYEQVGGSLFETFSGNFPSGTYFLRVNDGVNSVSLRVVMQ